MVARMYNVSMLRMLQHVEERAVRQPRVTVCAGRSKRRDSRIGEKLSSGGGVTCAWWRRGQWLFPRLPCLLLCVGRQPFPPTGRRVPALNPAGRVAGAVGCDDGIQQAFFVCVCVCV